MQGIQDCHWSNSRARGDGARRRRGIAGGSREDEVHEFGGDAESHELGQVGRAIRREGDVCEDGEPDARELEEMEEGVWMLWESGKSDVSNGKLERDGGPVYRGALHVDSEWAKGLERKSTSGGMIMIDGTVVTRCSRTEASRA